LIGQTALNSPEQKQTFLLISKLFFQQKIFPGFPEAMINLS
jgi:hypothetical protein